jgi:hypothetical protein
MIAIQQKTKKSNKNQNQTNLKNSKFKKIHLGHVQRDDTSKENDKTAYKNQINIQRLNCLPLTLKMNILVQLSLFTTMSGTLYISDPITILYWIYTFQIIFGTESAIDPSSSRLN